MPDSSTSSPFESVSAIATTISFGILCTAFVHEWAYFSVVGHQFQSFMGPSDYVTSAISWLPATILSLGFGALNALILKRVEGFRSEEEMAVHYRSARSAWWARNAPNYLLGWSFVFYAVLSLIFLNVYDFGLLVACGFAVIWSWGVNWFAAHEKLSSFMTPVRVQFLAIFPAFLFLVYSHGLSTGTRDISGFQRAYIVKMKADGFERNLILLRNFAMGLVVRESINNRISILKWDEISSVSLRTESPDKRSYLCWFFNIACFGSPRSPEP